MKIIFLGGLSFLLSSCQTYQLSNDPFVVGMRWFDRGNLKLAREYWEPLAKKNDCDGQNGMALILYHENLVKPEKTKLKESLDYFKKSAEQGHYKSISALGDLNYCSGDTKKRCEEYGLKPNKTEALKYYILASRLSTYDRDQKYNQQMQTQLEKEMELKQIDLANVNAGNWKASPTQCQPRKLI